ncbi:MAG: DUF928 domain-containing protein [Cyanothece sp. SIO2G6]|nr:DUF928 domain-containing protein [Cyanothece sp. SIO2G6]
MSSLLSPIPSFYVVETGNNYQSLPQFSALPNLISKNPENAKNTDDDADLGRPPNRTSGASRSSGIITDACPGNVIALVPGEGTVQLLVGDDCLDASIVNPPSRARLAYSSEAIANVWVYIPQAYASLGVDGELVLIDNRYKVDSWRVSLPTEAGVVCMPLPHELEADNVYRWLFEIDVNEQSPAENPSVSGWVEYTQQVDTYWYDNLTELGQQIQSDTTLTNAAIAQWQGLLDSQGLGAIAASPILNSCIDAELNTTAHNQLPTNTNGAQ